MNASVIVPARNARATLRRTLAALAAQDVAGSYEVIVVDDGSTDGTAELARNAPGPVTVITQDAAGPGSARNAGVARATAAVLAFCDADVFPVRGWLRAGLAALRTADLVQGKVLPDPAVRLGPFDRTIWITSGGGLWEAANMFVGRALFERVGGFPDGIRPARGKPLAEDVLFGYEALAAGAHACFSPDALAYHAVFPRTWRAYVAERRRLAHFPAMTRAAPDLRERFLYRRAFLNARTARLDLGVSAAVLALRSRSSLPLLATLPYLAEVRRHAGRADASATRRLATALADMAADLLGEAALLYGSVRCGAPVL
jgi:glycosyltransferase involved in cell wall biosynthesis